MVTGNCPVKVIRGAAFRIEFEVSDNVKAYVEGITISCSELGFCHQLTQDAEHIEKWWYLFDGDETASFSPVNTTYTVTIHSSVNSLEPQKLVNQIFEVIDDKNKSACEV